MRELAFVRHGITAWNKEGRFQGHRDIPLAEEGLEQAKYVAKRLADETWDVIVTSDLSRARQTAELIAKYHHHTPIVIDERLREIFGGKLDGTTESERVAAWGEEWYEFELGLESEAACKQRGLSILEDLMQRYPDHKILIVSHGTFLGYWLDDLLPKSRAREHLRNTSFTRLYKKGEDWECDEYNCIAHLDQSLT